MGKLRKQKLDFLVEADSKQKKNFDLENPIFSLTYAQKGYDVCDCTQEDKARLIATLSNMSKRTWKEIKGLDRHKGGFEQLPQLKDKVPAKLQGTIPIAFRFSGMAPVIGTRTDQIFYIIWIDPGMTLYKH